MRYLACLLLTACASVFDAPAEPLIQPRPVEYRSPQDRTPVLCEYVRDGKRWTMMVPRNECVGWGPV